MVMNLKIKGSVKKPREGNLRIYLFPHFTRTSPVDLIRERREKGDCVWKEVVVLYYPTVSHIFS